MISALSSLNVKTILGDRLDLASLAAPKTNETGERVVRTSSGKEIAAELVVRPLHFARTRPRSLTRVFCASLPRPNSVQLLCTGQTPNTDLLRDAFPDSPSVLVADGEWKDAARVRRTMQLAERVPADALPAPAVSDEDADEVQEDPTTRVRAEHVFVIGDAADAFGAINAGHCAYAQVRFISSSSNAWMWMLTRVLCGVQGEVAARNIVRLVKRAEGGKLEELEKYVPGPPAIKVSLGAGECQDWMYMG